MQVSNRVELNSLKIAKIWQETLRLPLQAYINRGGVGLECHFTFSPSQPCPELPAKPCPESQCHCRRRSLSCSASIAAVARVPAPQFRVSSPSHCTSDRAFSEHPPRAYEPCLLTAKAVASALTEPRLSSQ